MRFASVFGHFALSAALAACATAKPESRKAALQAPRPGNDGYTCSAKLSWSDPPTDLALRALTRRCRSKPEKATGAREVAECPCTQLGVALGYRKDATSRKRGMRVLMDACDAGSYDACDAYELGKALCLQGPEQPECVPLRKRGLIPAQFLALSNVLGCRGIVDQLLCVQRDRYYVRARDGRWDQQRVLSWRRSDSPKEARWEGRLSDGVIVLTPLRVVQHDFQPRYAEPVAGYSDLERVDPEGFDAPRPRLAETRAKLVGPSRKLSSAEQAVARRALSSLPLVEHACAAAEACARAVEKVLRPPPPPPEDEMGEGEGEDEEAMNDASTPTPSLLACQAARRQALAQLGGRTPPTACAPLPNPRATAPPRPVPSR